MKVLVAANPVAGAGRGRSAADRLAHLLAAEGHAVELFVSEGPNGIAKGLASRLAGVERIVAVGGDGTLNDVVNALADPGAIPLTQLAMGTANMLARELGLPRTPEAMARFVGSAEVRRMDLANAGRRRFLMNASVGFDAMVVEAIARQRHGALGFRGYVAPALRSLMDYREPHLEVRLDDGAPLQAGLVIVTNLKNYGGIMRVSDDARWDSGLLDVLVSRRARRLQLPAFLAAGLAHQFTHLPGVSMHRARGIRIDAPEPVAFQADGDWRGATPVEIAVEAGALAILVPRGAARPSAP